MNKEMYIDILRRLRDAAEGNASKSGERTVGFFFMTMLQHTGRFWSWDLSKERCNNTASSPILSWPGCSWFLPVPSTEISIEVSQLLWCYWHNEECDEGAEKAFTKWLPGMFPTSLQSLAEVYICTRGLSWRKCSLNDCTVLYFPEMK